MSDAENHEFLFSAEIWFLGPKPPYHDMDELRRVVMTGFFEQDEKSGTLVRVFYAFSDEDLAARFLKRLGPQAAHYVPLALEDDAQLIEFLEGLPSYGHQFLGVDVEDRSAIVLPIPVVIDQIRRRQNADTSPDSGNAD
jgi:hypothetical protein